MLPAIAWFIIKPLLYIKQKTKQDFHALQRIKFNTEIFNALLEKQKHITEPADGLGIILGNEHAPNTLIKVCNPYCGPCAKAHPEIEKLLEENKNLKVQIIFTVTNKKGDRKAAPVKHLLAIAEDNDAIRTKHALDAWYLAYKKDYDVFAAKYPMNGELKMQDSKIDNISEWCDKIGIIFTPTFFFNGFQLPDAYSIGDLKYFLAEWARQESCPDACCCRLQTAVCRAKPLLRSRAINEKQSIYNLKIKKNATKFRYSIN